MPVRVVSQPGSRLLMARPWSVHRALGKRRTSTSVNPSPIARLMMAAARLNASSSETPGGFDSWSIKAFFSASAFSFRRNASLAFSASARASFSLACVAVGSRSLIIVSICVWTPLSARLATKRHEERRGWPQSSRLQTDIGSRETVAVSEHLLHDRQWRRIGIFHSADDGVIIEGERRLEFTGKPLHPLILRQAGDLNLLYAPVARGKQG